MVNQKLLRLSALLLLISAVVFMAGSLPEPGAGNNYTGQFAATANNSVWVALHLIQFAGTVLITAGILGLVFALNLSGGAPRWLGVSGAIAAGVTLALAGVVYAVDGVALRQVSLAYVSATPADQAARFASAEAIRWLEWGIRSYEGYMSGLTYLLIGLTIAWTARVARPIGYVMGLHGLTQFLLGWFTGSQGFSAVSSLMYSTGAFLFLIWMVWLLIVAFTRKAAVQVQAAPA